MRDDLILGIRAALTNGTILGVVTLAEFELFLKIILLLMTIGFTGYQWVKSAKKKETQ